MIRDIEFRLSADKGFNTAFHHSFLKKKLGISGSDKAHFQLIKRSLDARKGKKQYILKYKIFINEAPVKDHFELIKIDLDLKKRVLIVGSGPAGLFAAIDLISKGITPIILERGKNVRDRRKDLVKISRMQTVDPDSNYCFGEGGAGTYSDGKLYTRSKKRGNVERILQILVHFGADESILIDSHPHIGTNKLPGIIENIRKYILDSGGEIHFNSRVNDLIINDDRIFGVIDSNGERYEGDAVILATGHSASDIYHLLNDKNVLLESKAFAIGVRIEHPQSIIDKIQYQCEVRSDYLPPASYSLVSKKDERGAYSFCMCPGGVIAPCATQNEEVVTNGWSPSKRNNPFANSGIVVPVYPSDTKAYSNFGPLSGLKFREEIEHKAWLLGGKNQGAPAQRLVDFLANRVSKDLPDCSYTPGISSADLNLVLPDFITKALRISFRDWAKRMPAFISNDAVLVGVESRTSSPVRIPRDPESLEHVHIKGLYPAGEGAGYAGGIVSAAIDGERCAEAIAVKMKR